MLDEAVAKGVSGYSTRRMIENERYRRLQVFNKVVARASRAKRKSFREWAVGRKVEIIVMIIAFPLAFILGGDNARPDIKELKVSSGTLMGVVEPPSCKRCRKMSGLEIENAVESERFCGYINSLQREDIIKYEGSVITVAWQFYGPETTLPFLARRCRLVRKVKSRVGGEEIIIQYPDWDNGFLRQIGDILFSYLVIYLGYMLTISIPNGILNKIRGHHHRFESPEK